MSLTCVSSFSKTRTQTVTYRRFRQHNNKLYAYVMALIDDPEIHLISISKQVK